ncbi:biotin-dependent carboxyltransferase family protein [Aureisphaera galaxeae]|uniref:5-oxoprolinase subunit C family protein n=1 Tax=Aureisphaera galaxeae TaxID=1538023 RepID=UPI00234FB922|nr:biotin-dependent carboxyltransferase family protein [Aureisphaera galaxeae]MDC8002555.1 biotin-dependent carboxyltransferase family protein [Aureisphaera galaxeae]
MIKVITSGLYTSIQDLGRYGFRKYGVPISGAMDLYSAELANRLAGNDPEEAVIEITLQGPTLHFTENTIIALTGADLSPALNGKSIANNTPIMVPKDSELRFGKPMYGVRCYLSAAGGIQSERILGSRSWYTGITHKGRLEKGDSIPLQSLPLKEVIPNASVKVREAHFSAMQIQAFKGPEFYLLPKEIQKELKRLTFTVSPNSNRMAYVLNSETEISAPEIITAPVQPGTIQLTPSGKWVVLMRDAQTTGGYARVLQLTEESINRLAQKQPMEAIQLVIV